ncbi:hypothetical protein NUH88_08515 [Nisaea acidiphila]|uniref:Tetratricopeptide repeat protein n=1 Tax=Nisaea acidiphila TaxID=1862145 RepID=A0A9J7AY55_9PROT|nr:hypothetical protein [Nisaea acidiphila]UUX51730.1 hypothetical protein NUH88_08515 [Nisaea acidiphila]
MNLRVAIFPVLMVLALTACRTTGAGRGSDDVPTVRMHISEADPAKQIEIWKMLGGFSFGKGREQAADALRKMVAVSRAHEDLDTQMSRYLEAVSALRLNGNAAIIPEFLDDAIAIAGAAGSDFHVGQMKAAKAWHFRHVDKELAESLYREAIESLERTDWESDELAKARIELARLLAEPFYSEKAAEGYLLPSEPILQPSRLAESRQLFANGISLLEPEEIAKSHLHDLGLWIRLNTRLDDFREARRIIVEHSAPTAERRYAKYNVILARERVLLESAAFLASGDEGHLDDALREIRRVASFIDGNRLRADYAAELLLDLSSVAFKVGATSMMEALVKRAHDILRYDSAELAAFNAKPADDKRSLELSLKSAQAMYYSGRFREAADLVTDSFAFLSEEISPDEMLVQVDRLGRDAFQRLTLLREYARAAQAASAEREADRNYVELCQRIERMNGRGRRLYDEILLLISRNEGGPAVDRTVESLSATVDRPDFADSWITLAMTMEFAAFLADKRPDWSRVTAEAVLHKHPRDSEAFASLAAINVLQRLPGDETAFPKAELMRRRSTFERMIAYLDNHTRDPAWSAELNVITRADSKRGQEERRAKANKKDRGKLVRKSKTIYDLGQGHGAIEHSDLGRQ